MIGTIEGAVKIMGDSGVNALSGFQRRGRGERRVPQREKNGEESTTKRTKNTKEEKFGK